MSIYNKRIKCYMGLHRAPAFQHIPKALTLALTAGSNLSLWL